MTNRAIFYDRELMEERLKAVTGDPMIASQVFPTLLRYAGQTVVRTSIREIVSTAFIALRIQLGEALVKEKYLDPLTMKIVEAMVKEWV